MVLLVGVCSVTELVTGELEGSAAFVVTFRATEENAECKDELELADTDWDVRGFETICDCPDAINTDVGTRL